MPDKFSKKTRSKVMSKIRSKNTFAETVLKKGLKGLHLRQHPKIYGNPDFGNKKRKIVIFVDGCFWHKCPRHYKEPKSRKKYWLPKLERNVVRAREVNATLKKMGWKVVRLWEHEIQSNMPRCIQKIEKKLKK